jgi:hypothetical protein
MSTQNQDKMKTKSKNIAPEGTRSGDVVGGFYLGNRGNPSGAFVFKGVHMAKAKDTPRQKAVQPNRLNIKATDISMKAKERHKCKLLEYLGNPENEFPTRLFMNSQIIGFKDPTHIYRLFSLDELDEIEAEALEIRRKKYKPEIARADKALFKKAHDGDVSAIKFHQRKN